MSSYFRGIPNFDYVDRNPNSQNISDYVTVKNLFKRGKIREEIFGDSKFFELYTITGDERPDHVARQIYDDESLDWIILLSNNILNVQSEWPLTQNQFDLYLREKYGKSTDTEETLYNRIYNGVHHYETKAIVNSSGVTVLKEGLVVNNEWKTNGNWIETITSKILNIYSGDNGRPSPTVIVELYGSGIRNLKVGDQIRIENISQDQYNGAHTVTEIVTKTDLPEDEYFAKSFAYDLTSAPEVLKPTLSFVLDKDGIPVGAHVEEARLTLNNSTLNGNSHYFEYFDKKLKKTLQISSTEFIETVTNYEYEILLEDAKRSIYALKSQYVSLLLEDVDRMLLYQPGGEQYVNRTLKRGDNIRLYT